MVTHLNDKKFPRGYFQSFFKRWHQTWGRTEPFVFISYNSKKFEVIFLDDLNTEELNEKIPEQSAALYLKLRALRKRNGKTLKEWGEELDMNATNLSAIEKRRRSIGPAVKERIVKVLEKYAPNDETLD